MRFVSLETRAFLESEVKNPKFSWTMLRKIRLLNFWDSDNLFEF